MTCDIIYEQPLNERMRTLLRLEHLFDRAHHHLKGNSAWDARAALTGLLDILALMSRGDIKSELLKELERQLGTLSNLNDRPGVDREKLRDITQQIRSIMETLHGTASQLGQQLKDNEFLNSLRQRNTMPGGTCDFDLPAYHYWLLRPAEERRQDMERWCATLEPAYDAAALILSLTRESTAPVQRLAEQGLYQQTLDASTPHQMIRVGLPREAPYFAEISAGRHRFSIRFMQQPSLDVRPTPVKRDVTFELCCCAL